MEIYRTGSRLITSAIILIQLLRNNLNQSRAHPLIPTPVSVPQEDGMVQCIKGYKKVHLKQQRSMTLNVCLD